MKMKFMQLNNTRGASIIMVMTTSLLLFFVGLSVLFAASNTSSAQLKRQQARICQIFAMDFAKKLTGQITEHEYTGDMSDTSPWKAIAQKVYDNKQTVAIVPIVIDSEDITITKTGGGAGGLWVYDDGSVTIDIEMQKNPSVRITQPYIAPTEAIWEDLDLSGTMEAGEIIVEATPEILECAEVSAKIEVTTMVTYRSAKYILSAVYEFSGTTQGQPGGGNGYINSGQWTLLGYKQK